MTIARLQWSVEGSPRSKEEFSYSEAPNAGLGVTAYGPGSEAAREIRAVSDEQEVQEVLPAAGLPWIRKVLFRLPAFLHPAPLRTARIIGIDRDGKVVQDLFDPMGERIWVVSSVQEGAGHLYLGSLDDHARARIPIP